MTASFPTSLPAALAVAADDTASSVAHHTIHNDDRDDIRAIISMLGLRGAYLGRRNRIINGDMRIAQRATLGTTDDTYNLDRWNLLLEGGWTPTQETSDVPTDGSKYALKLTADGNDNKGGVATYLEYLDCADLRGKTVSLQAKLKVSNARIGDVRMAVLEWTSTADSVTSDVVGTWGAAATNPTLATNWAYLGTPANLSPTTSWATYRVEGLTVGASANNLAVFIWIDDESNDNGDYLLITDVQLDEGPTCTGFERRPFAEELVLCRRYFEALNWDGATYQGIGMGQLIDADTARVHITYSVTKRVSPAASVSNIAHFGLQNAAGIVDCTGSINGAYGGRYSAGLDFDGSSAVGTAGDAVLLVTINSSARMNFSAEL